MKNATLRQLQVFEAVARHLSFSRAAEELHLTQPAVSTQVRKLCEHAGLPLLEQLGKRVFLTPAGDELLQWSREVIAKFREADEALARHKGVAGGLLKVSVISAGDSFFPGLLAAFVRRHPGVRLQLDVCNRQEMLARLAANQTDLAVMGRPPQQDEADTLAEDFAPHPYVVVAAPSHPLAGRRRVRLAQLELEPFIVREAGSDTRHTMQLAFGERMGRLRLTMEIRSTETIKQAVAAGMGLACLSAHTVATELRAGSLVVLKVSGFPFVSRWHVVQRRTKRLPPAAQAFKGFLLEEGARLIAQALGATPVAAPRRASPR